MISNNNAKKPMKRKKFFLYSGAAALGIFSLVKNPFKLLNRSSDPAPLQKVSNIRITQNPKAVSRNTTKLNNG